jgi:alanine-glyoxylate transaminase/serine-glyoxylate transaminase/serine-pyruvate transaminase
MKHRSGRHFLQIPGPTNVPDRVLRAIDRPTIDHRGPEFGELGRRVLDGLKGVFKTRHPVIIYPASGTGAWEAALVNTLSPGDRVLMYETGHFATLWQKLANKLGLEPEFIAGDWRHGADAQAIGARLAQDAEHRIKAVCVVHNETSTGVASRIAPIREALDRAGHPALLMVDTISSLGSIDYRADEWGVDVTVAGSQKGLMLPPGLSFNAVSDKALAAAKSARLPRSYWDWEEMLANNRGGYFPYTPATNLIYGLDEALRMLQEEGLARVFARHDRHAEATRRAVRAWGLEILCVNPAEYSSSLTAVVMPQGTTPIACASSSWSASTCRSAPASRSSRARSSASGTWATSTTSCCSGRSPVWRWAWPAPACRTARAECAPRWTTLPNRSLPRPRPRSDRRSRHPPFDAGQGRCSGAFRQWSGNRRGERDAQTCVAGNDHGGGRRAGPCGGAELAADRRKRQRQQDVHRSGEPEERGRHHHRHLSRRHEDPPRHAQRRDQEHARDDARGLQADDVRRARSRALRGRGQEPDLHARQGAEDRVRQGARGQLGGPRRQAPLQEVMRESGAHPH